MNPETAQKFSSAYSSYVEVPLYHLGLMQNPTARFGVAGALALGGFYLFKPQSLFDDQGRMRPMQGFSSSSSAVPLNAIALSLIVGGMAVIFI